MSSNTKLPALTDEQINAIWTAKDHHLHKSVLSPFGMDRIRAIIAADRERQAGEAVAFEFYNPATGHAIVDYSQQTHVGPLTKEMGYEARPLGYVTPPPAAVKPGDLVPLWQAREALDSLEESARGDAPYNHFAASLVRTALEQAALASLPAPQAVQAPEWQRNLLGEWNAAYPRMDIYAKPGTLVVFDGRGGYDGEVKNAEKVLKVRHLYEVDRVEVGSSSSSVRIKGVDGLFNTCLFAAAPSPDGKAEPMTLADAAKSFPYGPFGHPHVEVSKAEQAEAPSVNDVNVAREEQWRVVTWSSKTDRTFKKRDEALEYLRANDTYGDWYIEPVPGKKATIHDGWFWDQADVAREARRQFNDRPFATQPTASNAGERELLDQAHKQICHLINDLTLTIEDDGLTRYLPVGNLMYSNLVAALIELAPKMLAALASKPPAGEQKP